MNNQKQSFFGFLGFGTQKSADLKADLSSGRLKAAQRDHQGAIEEFSKAIEIDGRNASAFALRGYSKAELQDFRGAVADYGKARELCPEYAKCFYLARGNAKAHEQDYLGAIDDYTKSMELKNCPETAPIGNDSIYFRRGLSKIEMGQLTSGCSDLKKAADLGHAEAAEALKKHCS